MKVICRTNLDLYGEQWPSELPALPNVGDIIESAMRWENDFVLQLQVCCITWIYSKSALSWIPEIELHMTSWQKMLTSTTNTKAAKGSIYAFYEWYAPKVGKTVGNFI
jgi:hypothetical protein